MIRFQNLTKTFRRARILDNVNLQVSLGERVAQVVVKIRELKRVGFCQSQVAQVEPLRRKVFNQHGRPRVGQQAPGLLPEHHRILQLGDGR